MKRILALAAFALLPLAAPAQETSVDAAHEEVIQQILELQRQLEDLLATLPPDVRAELRERLAAPPEAPKPSAPIETPPETTGTSGPAVEDAAPVEPPVTPQATATTPTVTEAIPEPVDAAPADAAPTSAVPSAVEPTATEPAPNDVVPKLIRRRSRRAPCNTLNAFDENADGKISSADRYWRYLYLWNDRNGDRQVQDREVDSAYDRKVREIAVSLETFNRVKGSLGEIRIEDYIVLDLRGDGFSQRDRRDDGILVIDADALHRGNNPRLLGPGSGVLSGFAPFRSGLRLEHSGSATELNCP